MGEPLSLRGFAWEVADPAGPRGERDTAAGPVWASGPLVRALLWEGQRRCGRQATTFPWLWSELGGVHISLPYQAKVLGSADGSCDSLVTRVRCSREHHDSIQRPRHFAVVTPGSQSPLCGPM